MYVRFLVCPNEKRGLDFRCWHNTYLPVCKNRWFFRLVCFEKPREQIWHLNGHDPLCTYMCDLRSPGVGNDFEQRPHLCGFSCVTQRTKTHKKKERHVIICGESLTISSFDSHAQIAERKLPPKKNYAFRIDCIWWCHVFIFPKQWRRVAIV